MGAFHTLGAVTVTSGTPTPILLPILKTISAVSFSITNNIATISLGSGNLPQNGYNGPNGFPTQNAATGSKFDIFGPNTGMGQQVILWGFTVATYFNGKVVTVLSNDGNGTFSFAFTHANVASTGDSGKTAQIPVENYRRVRLETGSANGATDKVYVGDGNVSSTQYLTALTGPDIGYDYPPNDITNIPLHRVFIDGTSGADTVQVTIVY